MKKDSAAPVPAPARPRVPKSSVALPTAVRVDSATPLAVPRKHRGRSSWLVLAAVVVALLVAAFTFMSAHQSTAESVSVAPPPTPAPAPFEHYKAAPGLVEAASGERAFSFEVGGKIRAVYVDEGQPVKAGDVIAELENADLAAKLKSSQADLSATDAKFGMLRANLDGELKKAESEVARLKAEVTLLEPRHEDLEQARADAAALEADAKRFSEDEQRYANPNGRGTSWSVQLYDQAHRYAEAAAAKFAASKAHLRALETGSRPEEKDRTRAMLASAEAEVLRQKATASFVIQSAQAQVEQSRAQVDLAKAELQKTRIVAALSGTVIRKFMHPGEVIDALHPQPVVTVADLSRLRVRADVDEADFPGVAAGQRVKITADAFAGTAFNGTVQSVSNATGQKRFSTGESKERVDVKIVETVVIFDTPPPAKFVKLGLRVTALFQAP